MMLSLDKIALVIGVAGLACFLWPVFQRMSGRAQPEAPGSGRSLRSPLWWAGFMLTVVAIYLQRVASQQAAGL